MRLRTVGILLVASGSAATALSSLALFRPATLQPDYAWALPKTESADRVLSPVPGMPIGILDIPRLGLSSVVLEGEEPATLLLGVGHLPETPMPWWGGNSVLAGHRDTFFRPLAGIRRNDVIRFSTADAQFEYRVTETRIVQATDVEALAPTPSPTLTLITCYPFGYIGPASNRFIVRAVRRGPMRQLG